MSFGFGMQQGGQVIAAQLVGQASPAFLVARDDGMGFESVAHASSAMRALLGATGVTAAVETGDVLSHREELVPGHDWQRRGYARSTLTLDRHLGPIAAMVSGTYMTERGTVLGAHFDASLGGARADELVRRCARTARRGGGWSLGGSLRQGWTAASVEFGPGGGGMLHTRAFAGDIGKDGVFGRGDSIGLRVSQPLRVERGGLNLTLPTGWDYDTGTVSQWTTQRMNLAPQGREIDLEWRYARPWAGGIVQTNLFWRRNPGNIAALPADLGVALRWSTGF